MRLWHKKLLSVLPNNQLLSQWRELNCIAKNIQISGTPNHLLVNKVLDYEKSHFIAYTKLVLAELTNRNYNIKKETFKKFLDYMEISKDDFNTVNMNLPDIYKAWHNDRYLSQCYYNLQEKYDCGGISEEEWTKIIIFYKTNK